MRCTVSQSDVAFEFLSTHLQSGIGNCYASVIEEFKLPLKGKLDGADVRRLMRVHKVTIRQLSERMQITMKRIRQIREIGLRDRPTIRDWVQGITGEDPGEL